MIAPNTEYTLGKRAFILFALEQIKYVLVLVAFAILVSIFRDATGSAALAAATGMLTAVSWIAVILGLGWSYWKFRTTVFALQEFDLKMRSGIIEKREISIPYRQIQSVDIVRGLTHQMLGLSKLVMLTAGHEEAGEQGLTEVVLEPLGKSFAEELREALEEKIGVQIVRPEAAPAAELDAKTGE